MLSLSIRQPWAWLILHGKDVENRNWPTKFRGRFLIHAAKGMTLDEYHEACSFARCINPALVIPGPDHLERGGIVGITTLTDCVTYSSSPWFMGRYGFILRDTEPLPFRPCRGMLGFFTPDGNSPSAHITDHPTLPTLNL